MHITKANIPTPFRNTKSRVINKPTKKVGYLCLQEFIAF